MKKEYIDACENLGWTVYEDEDSWVELSRRSPAGEVFYFSVNTEDFVEEINEYAASFDVDEHVEQWIPSRGKKGVPSSIRELLEDAEAIKKMLKELSAKLTGEVYEGICPICGVPIEYYDNKPIDRGHVYFWTCSKCGTSGEEKCSHVFDGHHYRVIDGHGNLFSSEGIRFGDGTPTAPNPLDEHEGICPVCGASIEYSGDSDQIGEYGSRHWECLKCGASGNEGYKEVFVEHHLTAYVL